MHACRTAARSQRDAQQYKCWVSYLLAEKEQPQFVCAARAYAAVCILAAAIVAVVSLNIRVMQSANSLLPDWAVAATYTQRECLFIIWHIAGNHF